MDAFLEPLGRDLVGLAVRFHPFGQRTGAAEHLVDAGVGGAVALRITAADLDVEVVAHLVDEAHLLAGELARGELQGPQVRADEVGTLVGETPGARDVGQLGELSVRLPGQFGRLGRGFVGHRPAQFGIAGEGVDVAFLDTVEPQTEG